MILYITIQRQKKFGNVNNIKFEITTSSNSRPDSGKKKENWVVVISICRLYAL